LVAALTGETLEMVDIVARSHDHLECRNQFWTRCTVTGRAEQPVPIHRLDTELSQY